MPLKIEDVLGARVEMQLIAAKSTKVEGKDAIVATVQDHEGTEFRYGIMPDVVDKVLSQGHRDADKLFLKLPQPDKNKRINWVTTF